MFENPRSNDRTNRTNRACITKQLTDGTKIDRLLRVDLSRVCVCDTGRDTGQKHVVGKLVTQFVTPGAEKEASWLPTFAIFWDTTQRTVGMSRGLDETESLRDSLLPLYVETPPLADTRLSRYFCQIDPDQHSFASSSRVTIA